MAEAPWSASNLQTKSKVVQMPNNSSGTLPRTEYRSYRDFLESYGDSKNSKDDQESVSSTESGISSYNLSESKSNNTSTSSLNSEINSTSSKNFHKTEGVASRTGSFRNYLESYNNKKFGSVKPAAHKQNTIKSEIVIQINDPAGQQKSLGKDEPVFVTTINGDAKGDDLIDSFSPPPNFLPPPSPHRMINGHRGYSCLPPPPPPPFEELKNNHQDEGVCIPAVISPQIQNDSHQEVGCAPPTPPPPPKLPDLNQLPTGGKKWGTVELDGDCPNRKSNQQEKLPPNHAAATNLAKILTEHLLPRRKELESRLSAAEEQVSNKSAPNSPLTKVKNEQNCHMPPKPPQNGQSTSEPGENYTCFKSLVPPLPKNTSPPLPRTAPPQLPKIDYCTLPRRLQKFTSEASAPPLPRSPPPKVETNNISKHFQKMIDTSAPKLPQPPLHKVETNSTPKQFQKPVTVEMPAPKPPRSPPPKFEVNNGARQPQNMVTVEMPAPKLPRSPPPKFEINNGARQPQNMVTVEISSAKLPSKFETSNVATQPEKVVTMEKSSPKLPLKFETSNFPKQPQKVVPREFPVPKLPQSAPPKANGRSSPSGGVDFSTTTVVPVNDASTKVSKNDPNVRKLVYNTYRGFLGAYNNKANDMIATLPRSRVREDQGVSKQLESMAQAAAPPSSGQGQKANIPGRAVEPPLCVQNAMLTKDKKPFTYTPGGIDLSEIRSPRMARRLELNAMNEGVGPVPQQQHPHYPTGPLPPSALAAMQPQIQVQVFPTGGIPQHHGGGGPPPPPPPPCGVPPPPPKAPPKSNSPLPVDSFERPDMTKIIPENPMALLRKTSGPVIKRDPIFNKDNYGGAANRVNNVVDAPPPRQPQPMRQPEAKSNASGVGSIYIPPVNQNANPPTPPQRHPQSPQFANQRESSPSTARSPPAYYKRQPSLSREEPPYVAQRQSPAAATPPLRDQTPDSPKPTLSKAPTPWLQKRPSQETPDWAINDRGRDSPVVQEQPKPPVQQERPRQQQQPQQAAPWRQQQQQAQSQSPPPWQQRQPKQPDAQPWQQRQQQQPEVQPWQQKPQPQQPEPQPWQQPQQTPPWQQQQQQSPPIQIPQGGGVRKQVNLRDRPQESGPVERTEVVIVNEPPQVFHHPGTTQRIIVRQPIPQQNNYQQQQQQVRNIPVQREGASSNGHAPQQQGYVQKFNSPTTPGSNSDARSLNRQLSWNSNPTQSNTFRVLQKITNTDGDDDEDQPVIEHSPKMPSNFPQRQGSLKQNEGDQELMNKFKQEIYVNEYYEYPRYRGGHIPSKLFWMLDDSGLNQDSSLHNEVDPRYRGPHIPSKAFKLLQSMTGGPDEPPISSTVPQGQQNNTTRGPKVRTIPIQIEGDGPTKPYVPPSEQTVPEPKKYMGSSIPSRSFKILQAMTGPDDCANPAQACENNENYPNDPSSYAQWGYDPNYPPPSPYYYDPYWGYYSQNYPSNEFPNPAQNNNARMTPIPSNWGYYPQTYGPNSTPSDSSDSNAETSKKRSTSCRTTPVPWANDNETAKKQNGNARCTPVPFWPYYYPNYAYDNAQGQENQETPETDPNGNAGVGEEQQNYQQYPPYWDPYYYGYYYGAPPPMYPPVYSPYPFYPPTQADPEEVSGYSSNDEMSFYGARFGAMTPNPNTQMRPKSTAPTTPNLQKQLLQEITQAAKKLEEKRKNREEKQKEPERIKIQSERFEDDSSMAETSDSDTEMVGYEVCRPPLSGGLKAIRSVSDIKVYDADECSHCSDEEDEEEENDDDEEEDEVSENTTEENEDPSSICVVDENVPHQLSVIFEESERTESSARYTRESSVATTISEDTATIENSEDEDEAAESDGTVLVKLPLTFKISAAERQKVTLVVGNSEVKPQIAEKSNNKEERLKSNSAEQLLHVDKSVIRQVSSDSYETAESEGEIFYNTHNSNAVVKPNNIKDEVEVKYNRREEDVDWWGQIDENNDTPKPGKKCEENIIYNNGDIEDTGNSLEQDTISTITKGKELITASVDEQEIPPGSSSSEEDYWSYSRKEECYDTIPVVRFYNVDTVEDNKDGDLETNNIEANIDNNEENAIKTEVISDINVQEGMEKMEAVLTSIISTINSRTSPSCSEEDKTEEVDFWAQIINSPEKPEHDNVSFTETSPVPLEQEDIDTSSACSRNSSLSKSNVSNGKENVANGTSNCLESENQPEEFEDTLLIETHAKTEEDINQETEKELTCNGHIADKSETNTDEAESDLKPLSVQERIKALQESASCKVAQAAEETEIKMNIKERIAALEDGGGLLHVERAIHKRKSISRKNSLKSYEEYSEEEGDSGVTSDISRHISETDTDPDFSDLKKQNKYQRASTHSRLFKLLQDECDIEDVPEDFKEESQCERMQSRRELLNLPLHKNGSDPESFSSSGFTSPGSPTINDRLVNELIQSLLKKKQGRIFKHMTMEKVQAAALRILQEDMDGLETLSSSEDGGSFLSPKKPGTGSSTPARTPQEYYGNFNEYSQYYDTWADAARLYEGQYDVLPSKAFRLIQEHASANKTGAIGGLLARCPRVLSNKSVQKELMKLMESHESPSPSPDPPGQPPDAKEASNAS